VLKTNYGIAAVVVLLGLYPAFHLPVLKLILLVVVIGVFGSANHIDRQVLWQSLNWRYLAFAQFFVFFFINALIYPVWDTSKVSYRAIALESWGISLLCLIVLATWLSILKAEDLRRAIIKWLPVGLTISFCVASWIYFSGSQGTRVKLFTPNPLGPPFWFLILAVASFGWFFEIGYRHRAWRVAIFLMAGLMALYGGARLVMIAWVLSGMVLVTWGYLQSERRYRPWILSGAGFIGALAIGGILLLDFVSGGGFLSRMAWLIPADYSYDSLRSQNSRVILWEGAWSVISDNVLLGIGQANERAAIEQEIGWGKWYRAHQAYLSYLVAGGIPALVSGLLLQSPALIFLKRQNRGALLPAFLGIGVVVTLNCLTDSIFQSAVAVQAFMVVALLFGRASDVDQPILHSQKHTSSATV